MPDREKVISDIEQQIRWIEEIECHKFPGWLNVTNAMRDALALLKEQEHKDRMFHALEEDWKRLKALLIRKPDGQPKTACDGCESKGGEDCALGKPGSENAYCPNGKLR